MKDTFKERKGKELRKDRLHLHKHSQAGRRDKKKKFRNVYSDSQTCMY